MPAAIEPSPSSTSPHLTLTVQTRAPFEFVDLTVTLSNLIEALCIRDGLLTVQTRHTTTGLLVNEHEPLLLADLTAMFERLAPESIAYAHDDFGRRTVNLGPAERRNGYAHCRAALLRTSESIPIVDSALTLGRWQRIFLVDFDGGQRREVSVSIR